MEPAVSTVLAEVLSQLTAWGDLGDWRGLPGFQANRKPALGLEVSPIAGGTPGGRRRLVSPRKPLQDAKKRRSLREWRR
ncbi:hypothetical protein EGT51_00700 [Levilactobacillus suantsaiihabitans]|uniref:Uncharacterized protein n=1 Tax=Levilactobacillus suantsaiihabitans TaxID=2487722 RepID=A0A4Z0JD17_9LACO|nr:hypothetical protein EGT51_00700 [Levilactobacillus suantsaiihabitans]